MENLHRAVQSPAKHLTHYARNVNSQMKRFLLLTTHYSLLTTHYSLLTTGYLLLTTYSQMKRFSTDADSKQTVSVPGPGAYHPKEMDVLRKQQSTAENFGSKESRFSLGQRGIFSGAMPTPGPGSYEAAIELNDPLIKRSFNITIG